MYNEVIKKRYIQEKESNTNIPKKYLERLFNKTKAFEENLNKDISCFTAYEIIDFYKTISISTFETLLVMNNHLSLYTQWSLQENLVPDCQNHYAEIKNDTLLQCINTVKLDKSIITRKELYEWFAKLDNPGDKFVMLCLFEGIKGKEFCEIGNLKMSDFSGNSVRLCTGREITVSDRLVELAQETDSTLEHYGSSRTYNLEDEGYILKKYPNCKSDSGDFQRGRRIYQRMFKKFGPALDSKYTKPNDLAVSGMIEFINTRSEQLRITAREYLFSDYALEVKEKYCYDMKRLRVTFYKKYEEHLI